VRTQHIGSRRYPSAFHLVATDIQTFVQTCHRGLHPGVEEIGVKCLQPGGNSLLHVHVGGKKHEIKVLLNRPQKLAPRHPQKFWLVTGLWLGVYGRSFLQSRSHVQWIFVFLDLFKENVTGKQFENIPTWSKISHPGCRHWTHTSSTPEYKLCCHGRTKV
jgi:hypothetical protein